MFAKVVRSFAFSVVQHDEARMTDDFVDERHQDFIEMDFCPLIAMAP